MDGLVHDRKRQQTKLNPSTTALYETIGWPSGLGLGPRCAVGLAVALSGAGAPRAAHPVAAACPVAGAQILAFRAPVLRQARAEPGHQRMSPNKQVKPRFYITQSF